MTQHAQLTMTVEEISHRPNDSLVTLRTKNEITRRDSVLYLSALGRQITGLALGQQLRVTVETVATEAD